MIFRNFDNWDVYFDTDRKLLHGCVQFLLKDGSTVANIYDSDETAIANPQITDVLGRTAQQVFVNASVRAYFYKYIGQGTLSEEQSIGIDVTDVTKWVLQYTVESENIDEKEVDGESAMGVANMDNLRALDPYEVPEVDGARIVCLYGYYEAGDKEAVYYVWEEESEQPDNNGSVIQSNESLTGRWRMVQPTEHCDSRHFGIFPQDSADVNIDQGTDIIQLIDYCNLCGIRPFFNGSTDYPYFIYNSINVNSRNPIDVSNGTVFVDKGNSYMYGNFDINTGFQFKNGNTNIRSKDVRTSWNFKTCTGYENVIIDSTTTQNSFQNANVTVTYGTSNKTFTNCVISSDHKLGNNTFSKCRLTGAMIANNQQYTPTIDDTVIIDIDEFEDLALWLRLRDQQSGNIYDMHGRSLSTGSCSRDVYWLNACFDDWSYDITTQATFDNCRGQINLGVTSNPSVTFTNCLMSAFYSSGRPNVTMMDSSVNLRSTGVSQMSGLAATRSTVNGHSLSVYGPLSIHSTIMGLNVICSGSCACEKSTLQALDALEPVLVDCDIFGAITQAAVASPINFTIQGCRFLAGNGHLLSSTVPNSVVQGNWINNMSQLAGHFVMIDRTNIDPDESHHPYQYTGNTGPAVLQRLEATWTDVINTGPDYSETIISKTPRTQQMNQNDWAWLYFPGHMFANTEAGGGLTDPSIYLTEFTMFSVGTQNIGVLVFTGNFPMHLTQDMAHSSTPIYNMPSNLTTIGVTCPVDEQERPWFSSNVGTPKGIYFMGGYTWRITSCQYFGAIMPLALGAVNWTIPMVYSIHSSKRN